MLGTFDLIRRALARPRADLGVLALATLLVAPSIGAGLAADDYIHELALSQSGQIPGFARAPLDLFRFAGPDVNPSLLADGVLPWWTDANVHFAFLRPLASATHALDHALFPGNAPLMHVHTVLWALLSLVAVRALYRAVHGAGWLATLALALYALDDARGSPVTWIANRNELIGCAISVAALALHVKGRRKVAPFVFALAMLAGEGSIAVTAYLFAYALFVEAGPPAKRAASLAPYAAVVVVWAVVYRALGYGVAGSGVYFDPLRDPVDFLRALPERFAMLWLAQLGGPWSEGWNAYPIMFPGLEYVVAGLAVVAIAGAGVLFGPLLAKDKIARVWLVGAGLATLPACGAFPADRLLPWIGVGAMALTAQFLAGFIEVLRRRGPGSCLACARLRRARRRPARGRPAPGHGPAALAAPLVRHRAGPRRARPRQRQRPERSRYRVARHRLRQSARRSVRQLHSGHPRRRARSARAHAALARHRRDPVHLTREDERTLLVRPEHGFLVLPSERLLRNTQRHPFAVGETVRLGELEVIVTEVQTDGRPAEVRARFARPLEDALYVWLVWKGSAYAPFALPAVGASEIVPAADLVKVAYGPDGPVTRWLGSRE